MLLPPIPRSQSRLETPREFGSNRKGKEFQCTRGTDAGLSVSFGHSKEKKQAVVAFQGFVYKQGNRLEWKKLKTQYLRRVF